MFPVLRLFLALAALVTALSPSLAMADPAGRVGRIALLEGPTLFRIDREDAGSQATLNWPVSSGAILDTERGSRAEIWLGSTAFRLASDSRLEFAAVDDRLATLQLAAGTLAITVRDRDQAAGLEVRTPNGSVQFGSPGSYRIDVGSGRTNVATVAGSAYVAGGDRAVTVTPGRTASIDANGATVVYGESLHDGFDDWVASRDAATRARTAPQYVSSQMTGYQDLDSYGDWGTVADYGSVWYPRAVAADWAPYRYGRWAWVAPWGWTWVDAAPWGFAPFHYGRWVEVRGRWGWVPGSYAARPVYAPALVAWVGNPGWSVSVNAGSVPAVGWFPLAPREVYVPTYRVSTTYVHQVNFGHVNDAALVDRAMDERGERHFVHSASTRAVTVVPASMVREGGAISAAAMTGRDQRDLRQAPISARAPTAGWLAPTAAAARPQGPMRRPEQAAMEHDGRDPARFPSRGFDGNGASRPGAASSTAPVPTPTPQIRPAETRGPAIEARPLPVPADRRNERGAPEPALRSPQPQVTSAPAAPPPVVEKPRNAVLQGIPETRPAVPPAVDRRNERPASAGSEPAQQIRPPAVWQQAVPAAAPERPRYEPRQVPVESRPAPVESRQVMPAQERRAERPAPVISEPPRQREVAPPVQVQRAPAPPAAPQMERRAPPQEPRPANEPREGQQHRHEPGNGPGMQ